MKTCNRCKELKSKIEFHKKTKSKNGLSSSCKKCCQFYGKEYRLLNKEILAINKRKYVLANPEKKYEANKKWANENPEKAAYAAKKYNLNNGKEKKAIYNKKYRKNNLTKLAAKSNRRRALKLNAGGTYTVLDINTLLVNQDSKCVYCKTKLILEGKGKYHVDHKMPLFLGGSNYPDNLQLLCPFCNHSKGYKHPDVFEKFIGIDLLTC